MKKELTLASALLGLAVSFGTPVVSDAAYQLNEEVKNPTPALLEASSIGVRTHETKELKNQENKDAIVVMSFGTTYKETRAKTIDATVAAIQAAHPNTKVVTAFTSHIIRDRIQAKEGITYPTPEEALDQLKAAGYTRVALTTLDVIPGMEYNYDVAVFNLYKNNFKKMTLGTPLMYWMGQENQTDEVVETLKAVTSQFPKLGKDDAVLIMAHGTPDPSNAYYAVIQDRIDSLGLKNTFIYTVEGTPNLEQVIPQLKAKGIKHVTLMPFMMVAGDHANNDMAGDEPDSHKSILTKEGFKVDTYLHGLGENQNIRKIFVERANEAWDALQK
ncbi:sirohydrochlorin cobaltochelatase [Veillonella sp. AS16]|uniref:sirohydrochlorin cobaltochelatase n=1 Tax=Veillonella sp. AS16 TaxID=936589 RepID=UPI0003E24B56|nr:sirohydrochlorin cobaltochelatase [Veillonella sp. AS16]ETS93175.1 putative sirohydrochlorin cobaltochelatase [Veillonella sp. AS16]